MRHKLALLALTLAGVAHADVSPPYVDNLDRPFNTYTWLTTHNAFNDALTPVPNQTMRIPEQLTRGVRGLMLDLVEQGDRVYVCHGVCVGGEATIQATLNDVVLPFLRSHTQDIVSLHVEGNVSRSALQAALSQVPGLAAISFRPDAWRDDRWPTLREMIAQDQRLLIFHISDAMAGDYPLQDGVVHVMASRQATVENYWSLGDTIFTHDDTCKSRWNDIPLDRATVGFPGKQWPRLFTMNQFHGVGERLHARLDNRFDYLLSRAVDDCGPVARRTPNFIAVDHFEQGDGLAVAGVLSQGGVVFYEGNGASQDIVCGVPGRVSIDANLRDGDFSGCENDEMRSARLMGLPAGTRITVFDSPSGSGGDDYSVITLKRDITDKTVSSFERTIEDSDITLEYFRKNGLDGKVSRIRIEPAQ